MSWGRKFAESSILIQEQVRSFQFTELNSLKESKCSQNICLPYYKNWLGEGDNFASATCAQGGWLAVEKADGLPLAEPILKSHVI